MNLGWRSLDTTRLIVYPALGLLALATLAARAGWFATGSSAGPDPTTVLYGETAQHQRIAVSVDRHGNILALQTQLIGVCRNGQRYPVAWSPNSPRIPFVHTPAGVFVQEVSTQKLSGGVTSRITATTIAHVHGREISGDAGYDGAFRYPRGAQQWCSSDNVHWTAYAPGAKAHGAGSGGDFSLGAWAGYLWQGRVRSVAASWRVPRISPDSDAGVAATWIGAQARSYNRGWTFIDDGPPFGAVQRTRLALQVPFIQVGLNEDRVATASGATYDWCFAFWTDPLHGDLPIRLFGVAPGDKIVAALTLAAGRWTVSIRDLTSGKASVFSTREEAGASFRYAEWLQENPSAPPFGTDQYVYPNLSTVRFENLEVNAAPPARHEMADEWMSAGGGYLAPSSLTENAFSVRPATLSPAGVRYLAIATAEDSLLVPLFRNTLAATAGWHMPPAVRARTARGLERALGSLRNYRWPTAARPLVLQEIGNLTRLIAATKGSGAPLRSGPTNLGWGWIAAVQASSETSQAIRRALGLPRQSFPDR
jgi:hypothetical protein